MTTQNFVTRFVWEGDLGKLNKITKKITDSFSAITKSSTTFARSIAGIGKGALRATGYITGMSYAIYKLGTSLTAPLNEFRKLSASTGTTADNISNIAKGLRTAGASKDAISSIMGFTKQAITASTYGGEQPQGFYHLQNLGLGLADFRDGDLDDLIKKILAGAEATFADTKSRMAFLGRLGIDESLGMLNAEELEKAFGYVGESTTEAIQAAKEFNIAMGEMSVAFDNLKLQSTFFISFLTQIINVIARFFEITGGVINFFKTAGITGDEGKGGGSTGEGEGKKGFLESWLIRAMDVAYQSLGIGGSVSGQQIYNQTLNIGSVGSPSDVGEIADEAFGGDYNRQVNESMQQSKPTR